MSGFDVACAVWHNSIRAEVITASVGLSPHIGWSAGDLFERVGRPRDRTYCRFALGVYSQQQISDGQAPLHRFKALRTDPSFSNGGGRLSVYFKNMDWAAAKQREARPQPETDTSQQPSSRSSKVTESGRKRSITDAPVRAWPLGFTVVKQPPPASASGSRSWSAR